MLTLSLKKQEIFKRADKNSESYFYGCEQEWYLSDRQKQSGCGPTTACNLLSYIELSSPEKQNHMSISKEEGFLRMQESWEYVTPTEIGIPTIAMFCDKFLSYANAKNMDVSCHCIDVGQEENTRPDFKDIVTFIEAAMLNDSPVAFLNLCNGKAYNLEDWHWVTIIAMEHDSNKEEVNISFIDKGCAMKIDLKLWYDTTKLGGGFLYFEKK